MMSYENSLKRKRSDALDPGYNRLGIWDKEWWIKEYGAFGA